MKNKNKCQFIPHLKEGDFLTRKIKELDCPELVFKGKLTNKFVKSIETNDWTQPNALYPNVKEGVVITRSTRLPGQTLPKCKVKTKWWLDELHAKYPEDKWKDLE